MQRVKALTERCPMALLHRVSVLTEPIESEEGPSAGRDSSGPFHSFHHELPSPGTGVPLRVFAQRHETFTGSYGPGVLP